MRHLIDSEDGAQRQRFEVWADDQGFSLRRLETSDGYLDLRIHGAWDAWQACVTLQQQEVPHNWLPTAENINALPEPLRLYVAGLETLCDPAGIMRENALLKDSNRGLQAMYRKAADFAQEVPREPVAWYCQHVLTPSMGIVEGWLTFDKDEEPDLKTAPGTSFVVRTPLYAFPSTTQQQEAGSGWILYEHEDGRHAVTPSADAATFAHGDPAWHRVGPVEVHGGSEQ